jgi:hypothetical protein
MSQEALDHYASMGYPSNPDYGDASAALKAMAADRVAARMVAAGVDPEAAIEAAFPAGDMTKDAQTALDEKSGAICRISDTGRFVVISNESLKYDQGKNPQNYWWSPDSGQLVAANPDRYPAAAAAAIPPIVGSDRFTFNLQNADGSLNPEVFNDLMRADQDNRGQVQLSAAYQFHSAGTPEAQQDVMRAASSNLIKNWAMSSNDNNTTALAIQQVAAKEFNLSEAEPWKLQMNGVSGGVLGADGKLDMTGVNSDITGLVNLSKDTQTLVNNAVEKNGDVYSAFVHAQYDETQATLAAHGVDSVDVYRGVRDYPAQFTNTAENLPVSEQPANQVQYKATMRPLSSWSTAAPVAKRFAGDYGVVTHARIPAENVLSLAYGTGNGCTNEHEVVVLGRPVDVLATRMSSAPKGWATALPKASQIIKSINLDNDDYSADWIKSLRWDLPTDSNDFLSAIGGRNQLNHFLSLPAAEAMPAALASALGVAKPHRLDKAFNPDQQRDEHGRWTSTGSSGDNLTIDDVKYYVENVQFNQQGKVLGRDANVEQNNASDGINHAGKCAQRGIRVDWGSSDPAVAKQADDMISNLLDQHPEANITEIGTSRSGQTEEQTWSNVAGQGVVAFTEGIDRTQPMLDRGADPSSDNPTDEEFKQWDKPQPSGSRIIVNPALSSNKDIIDFAISSSHENG